MYIDIEGKYNIKVKTIVADFASKDQDGLYDRIEKEIQGYNITLLGRSNR
jgi:hypothetical protein